MLKKINSILNYSIILSVAFAVLGIVQVIYPEISLTVISYIISGLLILYGLFLFVLDYKLSSKVIFIDNISNAILSIIIGIVILIYPKIVGTIIPIVLGIWFIIGSIFKTRLSLMLKDNSSYWILTFLLSLLSILCGIMLILNPFETALAITTITGIILIVYSISDIIDIIIFKKNINKLVKYFTVK